MDDPRCTACLFYEPKGAFDDDIGCTNHRAICDQRTPCHEYIDKNDEEEESNADKDKTHCSVTLYMTESRVPSQQFNPQELEASLIMEHKRQLYKWGYQTHDVHKWDTILGEEVGELSKAFLEYEFQEGTDTSNIYNEAISIAVLALKIAKMSEQLPRQKGKSS